MLVITDRGTPWANFALQTTGDTVKIGRKGRWLSVRRMEFKMERQGLLQVGQQITVTEGVLPSNYYYTIDPSLAMSCNYPYRERMLDREVSYTHLTLPTILLL